MRAHEIIFEASQQALSLRSRDTTWKDLAQALPKLQTAVNQFNQGHRIYRGLANSHHAVLFKPQMPKGTRESANNHNYCTLFMDNTPQWANYPPRSASVIATTDGSTAEGYGTSYIVLPEGDPVIGIAPRDDLWISFPSLGEVGEYGAELPQLNNAIQYVMREWFRHSVYRPKNWQQLKQDLGRMDAVNHYSYPNLPENPVVDPWTQQFLSFHPGTTIEQKLEYLLDPKANGFELTKLSTFRSDDLENNEVWFTAPCWLINIAHLPYIWTAPGFDLAVFVNSQAVQS